MMGLAKFFTVWLVISIPVALVVGPWIASVSADDEPVPAGGEDQFMWWLS